MIKFSTDKTEKSKICRKILEALPDWFGIPESTEEYIKKSAGMPFMAEFDNNEAIGFLAIKQTSKSAADVYVMGILPEHHKKGIGKALIQKCEDYCTEQGLKLLQVKTMDKSFPDEYYERTRLFYEAVGFLELECIPEIWGETCPCLIMVKPLR